MRFEKKKLDDIVRCYCASHMTIGDDLYAFFASENPESECYSYTGDDFSKKETCSTLCRLVIIFPDVLSEFGF